MSELTNDVILRDGVIWPDENGNLHIVKNGKWVPITEFWESNVNDKYDYAMGVLNND